MFNMQAGTKLVHVPYKGIAPAVTGVVSGEVNLLFGPPAVIVPAHQGRAAARHRSAEFRKMIESDFKRYSAVVRAAGIKTE